MIRLIFREEGIALLEMPEDNTYGSHYFDLDKKQKLNLLMDEYGNSIIRLAYTYVRSKPVAEDIAQDVFLKCYEKIDEFRGDSSYKTWLYRITVNKCKDHLKSWSFRNLISTDLIGSIQKLTNHSADEEFFIREENRIISEKVLSLPLLYREIIILYYYEHLSIEEIASLLAINANTIKSRLLRGKKMLKKKLGGGEIFG